MTVFFLQCANDTQAIESELVDYAQLIQEIKKRFPSLKCPDVCYYDKDEDALRITNDGEFNYAVRWATHHNEDLLVLHISEKPGYVEPLKSLVSVACDTFGASDVEEDLHEYCEDLPAGVDLLTEKISEVFSKRKEIFSLAGEIFSEGWKDLEERVCKVVECPGSNLPAQQPKEVEMVEISAPVHSLVLHNALCDVCGKQIQGVRYKCMNCEDFDLCSACEELNAENPFHESSHIFVKLSKPSQSLPAKDQPPKPAEPEVDSSTEAHLATLSSMGFSDRNRNLTVLRECNGDLEATLERLL